MSMLAWLFGFLGGLCAVMGVITATEVVPLLDADLTPTFWLLLGIATLLISIALAIGNRGLE